MSGGPAVAEGAPVLRQVLTSQRRPLLGSSALFMSHQVGEATVPVVAGALVDRAVVTADGGALLRWLVVLAVVFAVLSTSWRWGDRIFTRAYEAAGHDLRLRLAARATAPGGTVSTMGAGEVVSVASSDVEEATGVMEAVASFAAAVLGILTAAVALLVISPRLGLVVLLGLPPVLALLQVLLGPIERRASAQQADVARAAATATDLLRGLRVVKGLHVEAHAAERYRRASRASLGAGLRASRLHAAQSGLTVLVTGLFVAVIALVGGRMAADGSISIGALVAAVGVTQFLVSPLGRIGWAVSAFGRARASATRVAAVLDAAPAVAEPADGHDPLPGGTAGSTPVGQDHVVLRDVHHGPLAGLDLLVASGALVAVAASEAEAEALAGLLARTTDPDRGTVAVGGRDVAAWRLAALRRTVLVAEHDAPLFTGTVADNLVAGAPAPDDLDAILAAVAADEVAEALPLGLGTPVTERGLSLSGGQRQRVALARALVADPPVLVLHDPTTAIDSVTEARMAEGLRARRRHRTTVVLTTSPALLAVADEVVVVVGGAVAARGTHAELVAAHPAYARMVLT